MEKSFPEHSTFINFGRAVRGQEFPRRLTVKYFNKLVSRDDYSRKDYGTLIRQFLSLGEACNLHTIKGSTGKQNAMKMVTGIRR